MEDINDYRMLVMKDRLVDQLEAFRAGGVEGFDERPPLVTLLDRPFSLKRTGEGSSTTEILKDLTPPADIPEAVRNARHSAPDLVETLMADMAQEGGAKSKTLASGSGRDDLVSMETAEAAADDETLEF